MQDDDDDDIVQEGVVMKDEKTGKEFILPSAKDPSCKAQVSSLPSFRCCWCTTAWIDQTGCSGNSTSSNGRARVIDHSNGFLTDTSQQPTIQNSPTF